MNYWLYEEIYHEGDLKEEYYSYFKIYEKED